MGRQAGATFEATLPAAATAWRRRSLDFTSRCARGCSWIWRGSWDDQRRKFHVDHHRYGLGTTYAGPGTEWVPNEAVRREALNHPTDCPCDASTEIVRGAGAVHLARAGDVLLMNGAGHESVLGAVHRSPTIEGACRTRAMLIASTVNPS